jgi:hypothetical protein
VSTDGGKDARSDCKCCRSQKSGAIDVLYFKFSVQCTSRHSSQRVTELSRPATELSYYPKYLDRRTQSIIWLQIRSIICPSLLNWNLNSYWREDGVIIAAHSVNFVNYYTVTILLIYLFCIIDFGCDSIIRSLNPKPMGFPFSSMDSNSHL